MKEAQFWEACGFHRKRVRGECECGCGLRVRSTNIYDPSGKEIGRWPDQDANNFFEYVLPVLTKKDNIRLGFYKNKPVEIAPLYKWAAKMLGLEE